MEKIHSFREKKDFILISDGKETTQVKTFLDIIPLQQQKIIKIVFIDNKKKCIYFRCRKGYTFIMSNGYKNYNEAKEWAWEVFREREKQQTKKQKIISYVLRILSLY